MSKTLFITAHPLRDAAYSKSLTAGKKFKNLISSNEEIETVDLYRTNWADIDEDVYSAFGHLMSGGAFEELNDVQKEKLSSRNAIMEQFLSADKYVFVYPMWELSFPANIKKYLDTVVAANQTFKYGQDGLPHGILENKKSLIISSSGSDWNEENDYFNVMKTKNPNWQNYGRDLMAANLDFMGIDDIKYVNVDRTNIGSEEALNDSISKAEAKLTEIANKW